MGRGDNRKTPKMRRLKARAKLKARIKARIAGTKPSASAPKTTATAKKAK